MRNLPILQALVYSALLAGCRADDIQSFREAPAYSNGQGVEAAASGSGHLVVNGELRKFTFDATTHRDGSITGQFNLVAGNADLTAHGTVTCMTVIGNQAWIGGTLDRNSVGAPFTHGWWRAVDNAGGGVADQISVLVVANDPTGNLAEAFCADTPAGFPPLNDVTQGNVSVR